VKCPVVKSERAVATATGTTRWARLGAVAATLALTFACGGRAQDTEEGDLDSEVVAGSGAAGNAPSSRPRPNGGSSGSGGSSGPQPQTPRAGEICYSPASIASAPGIGSIAAFLPDDAFDDNGCVSSEYSSWLDGGGCNYDPRPAVVRGDQCCHLLDATMRDCG
jgi:hypothetical protein